MPLWWCPGLAVRVATVVVLLLLLLLLVLLLVVLRLVVQRWLLQCSCLHYQNITWVARPSPVSYYNHWQRWPTTHAGLLRIAVGSAHAAVF